MLLTDVYEIKSTNSLVEIQCDYCGSITKTSYKNFLKGRKRISKDSCTHCVGKKCAEITMEKRRDDCHERLLEMCKKKGYLLTTKKEEIVNNRTYIRYRCPIHGERSMKIANFLLGKGCPECQRDNARDRFKLSRDNILREIADCGGELLNPEEYINNRQKNLKVKCPSCGNAFITSFVIFTQHGGQVCNECKSSESIGEMRIRKYLEKRELRFIQEHWFADCRDIKPLPFDFYLPEYNRVIEFDGRQHFDDTGLFSYGLEKTHEHDRIKDQYCMDNGIDIIRIPYTKINQIDGILDEVFT